MTMDQNGALQQAHHDAAAGRAGPSPTNPPTQADNSPPLHQALRERDRAWDAREHVKGVLYKVFIAWNAKKTPDTYAALQYAREHAKEADATFDRAAGRLLEATLHEN